MKITSELVCGNNILVNLDMLRQVADRYPISFEGLPIAPIEVANVYEIDMLVSAQLIQRYLRHGFAVLQIHDQTITSGLIIDFAKKLNLGNPFVPPLYQSGSYTTTAISEISAEIGHESSHPYFKGTVGLEFHVDGTLQKIGYVKTTVMLCKSISAQGGDTTLFNSTGAFSILLETDPEAAVALATPGIFQRIASLNGSNDVNSGPAFSVEDNFLVSAYSMTHTDSIKTVKGVNLANLARGEEFLKIASRSGSPYYAQFKLLPGQILLLANSSISHGRMAYNDNQSHKRCMYRALFLRRPKINSELL